MADEVVGSAYVVIRAITERVRDDIKKGVKKGATASDKESEAAGKHIGERIGETAGETAGKHIREGIVDETTNTKRDYEIAGKTVGDSIGKGVTDSPGVKGIGRRIADVLRGDRRGSRGGSNYGKKIGKAIGDGISKIPLLPFILTMLVPALGGALKIISAYVGSAVALLGSLGPAIAGSAAAGVGAYLALGQAVGAVTLAFKTQSPLLKRFMNLMDGVKERFEGIGINVQQALLPELGDAIERISRELLPELDKALTRTGSILGYLAQQAAKTVETPIFQRSFADLMQTNNGFLQKAGQGFINLADAFIIVLSAARPVIRLFGDFINRMGFMARDAAEAGKRTGELNEFFVRARESMKQWGRIISNVFGGIFNILQISSDAGQTLTDRIEKVTKRFRDFTESASGENKIARFFNNSLKVVHAFNALLGDLFGLMFGGLAKPGGAKGVVEFIDIVRVRLLPALATLAGSLSELGPGLIDLTVAFADLVSKLADSGALGAFVETLEAIFDIVGKLIALPIAGNLIAWGVGLAGIGKALSLFLPLGKILGLIGSVMGALVPMFATLIGGWTGVTAAADGAAVSMGAALAPILGPALLVAAAIAAIIAVGILLYRHNERFRALVKKAWGDIQKAVQAVTDFFMNDVLPAFQEIIAIFVDGWAEIANGTGTQVTIVRGIIQAFMDFIVNIFEIGWGLLSSIVQGVWQAIKGMIQGALLIIKGIFNVFFGVLTGNWKQAWTGLKQIFLGVWTAIKGGLRGALTVIIGLVKASVSLITAPFRAMWSGLGDLFKNGWSKIMEGIRAIPGMIRGLGDMFRNAGSHLIESLINGLQNVGGLALDFATSFANVVIDVFNDMIHTLNDLLEVSVDTHIPGVGHVSVDAPDIGDIPHLAGGGITRRPTQALIGESGSEAVVPLEGENAKKVAKAMGLDTADQHFHVTVNNPIAERTSETIQDTLTRIAQLGLLSGGRAGEPFENEGAAA